MPKTKIIRNVILVVCGALAVVFTCYVIWYKNKDWFAKITISPLIIFGIIIAFIGLLILVGYLIYNTTGKGSEGGSLIKVPITPKRAKQLFIEEYVKQNNIDYHYNSDGEFVISNPEDLIIHDIRPFFTKPEGDQFLIFEFEVRTGRKFGLHIIIIPIDRGEEAITEQYWVEEHNQNLNTFKLNSRNYPLSSATDKKERKDLAILESMQNDYVDEEKLKLLQQPEQQMQQKTEFVSPFEEQNENAQ